MRDRVYRVFQIVCSRTCHQVMIMKLREISIPPLESKYIQLEMLLPHYFEVHLKARVFLYTFEESVDCHLLSSFCDNSNLHIFLFKYVLSTMGVSKESINKFIIGNRFHVKLRILSPENCKQSLRVKIWKAGVAAEKKQTQDYNQNFVTQAHKS